MRGVRNQRMEGELLPSTSGRGAGGEGKLLPSTSGRGAGGEGIRRWGDRKMGRKLELRTWNSVLCTLYSPRVRLPTSLT